MIIGPPQCPFGGDGPALQVVWVEGSGALSVTQIQEGAVDDSTLPNPEGALVTKLIQPSKPDQQALLQQIFGAHWIPGQSQSKPVQVVDDRSDQRLEAVMRTGQRNSTMRAQAQTG